jgi:hypothetical protein
MPAGTRAEMKNILTEIISESPVFTENPLRLMVFVFEVMPAGVRDEMCRKIILATMEEAMNQVDAETLTEGFARLRALIEAAAGDSE